jgi:hypothetical protein
MVYRYTLHFRKEQFMIITGSIQARIKGEPTLLEQSIQPVVERQRA